MRRLAMSVLIVLLPAMVLASKTSRQDVQARFGEELLRVKSAMDCAAGMGCERFAWFGDQSGGSRCGLPAAALMAIRLSRETVTPCRRVAALRTLWRRGAYEPCRDALALAIVADRMMGWALTLEPGQTAESNHGSGET